MPEPDRQDRTVIIGDTYAATGKPAAVAIQTGPFADVIAGAAMAEAMAKLGVDTMAEALEMMADIHAGRRELPEGWET